MLPVTFPVNCNILPPNIGLISTVGNVLFLSLFTTRPSVDVKFANDPSEGSPLGVLTSNPPVGLSPKEILPMNKVCVPKYNDKNLLV